MSKKLIYGFLMSLLVLSTIGCYDSKKQYVLLKGQNIIICDHLNGIDVVDCAVLGTAVRFDKIINPTDIMVETLERR